MNQPAPTGDSEEQKVPEVVSRPDREQLRQMIAPIKSPATQVGESIVHALQQDNTVAVITTVVVGPDGGQHVVTAALDPELMSEVQMLLARASVEREDDEPCMGFHCLVRPKGEAGGPTLTDSDPNGAGAGSENNG